jgi:hypothetical protein
MASLFNSVFFGPSSSSSETPLQRMDSSPSARILGEAKKEFANDIPQYEKCDLRVQGMTCGACVEVSSPAFVGRPI